MHHRTASDIAIVSKDRCTLSAQQTAYLLTFILRSSSERLVSYS